MPRALHHVGQRAGGVHDQLAVVAARGHLLDVAVRRDQVDERADRARRLHRLPGGQRGQRVERREQPGPGGDVHGHHVPVRHRHQHAVLRPLHAQRGGQHLVEHAHPGRAEEVVRDHDVDDAGRVAGLRDDVLDVRQLQAPQVVHRHRPDGLPAAQRREAVGVQQLRHVRRVVDRGDRDDAGQHLGRVRRRLRGQLRHRPQLEQHLVADVVQRLRLRGAVRGHHVAHVAAGDVRPRPPRARRRRAPRGCAGRRSGRRRGGRPSRRASSRGRARRTPLGRARPARPPRRR